MPTIAIDMNLKQIEEVIDKLDFNKKIKLIKDLEKATWPDRFRSLLSRIDRRMKTHPVLEREIIAEVEKVRKKGYAQSSN